MKAVVLAGGKGTRLEPYTKILPKPLMPIGDRPILEIILNQSQRANISEVILTVGHLASLLRAFIEGDNRFGMKIYFSYEDQPLGTAGPLSLIEGLDETFLVTNGDILTTLDINQLVEFHHINQAVATIATYLYKVRLDLGVIQLNSTHVVGYLEKPTYEFRVSMGIYVFEPRVLRYIPYHQYLDFPDLVQRLIQKGERVIAYPFSGYWRDLGRFEDYEQAVQDFEQISEQILGAGL